MSLALTPDRFTLAPTDPPRHAAGDHRHLVARGRAVVDHLSPVDGDYADPFAEAVHFNFDGRGNVSGSSTADYGGQSFPVTFTGTYSVNPNCTGSATFNLGDDNLVHRNLVIVAEGKEVEFVSTDLGLVIAGSMKKQ